MAHCLAAISYRVFEISFRENSAPREKFDCYFSGFFCKCWQNFHLAAGLGTRLSFYEVFFFFSCVGTKARPAAKMPWGKIFYEV